MKYILILGTFLLSCTFFIGCSSDEEQLYRADFMKDCFSTQELKLLNEGVEIFEEIMLEHYDESDRDGIYLKFSHDLGFMKLPPAVFRHAKAREFIRKMASSGLSQKIWVRKKYENSGFYALNENERTSIREYFSTSTEAAFFKCMLSKAKDGEFSKVLEVFKREGMISPDILAIGITHLSEKTIKLNTVKVFIVYALFYESAMTINYN